MHTVSEVVLLIKGVNLAASRTFEIVAAACCFIELSAVGTTVKDLLETGCLAALTVSDIGLGCIVIESVADDVVKFILRHGSNLVAL